MSEPVRVPIELLQGGITVMRPGLYSITASESHKKHAAQQELAHFRIGTLDTESHTEKLDIDLMPFAKVFVYHEGTCIIIAERAHDGSRGGKRRVAGHR